MLITQNSLFFEAQPQIAATGLSEMHDGLNIGVTFKDSLATGPFGWYPYVEGFSAAYVKEVLNTHKPTAVYDPFGGSGTTNLAAAQLGIPSGYCEVNPFMVFVAKTKLESQQWAISNQEEFFSVVNKFVSSITAADFNQRARARSLSEYESAFPDRDFFELDHVRELLTIRDVISEMPAHEHSKNLLLLACCANVVKCSNMTRRADLRRRRENEYKNRIVEVVKHVSSTAHRIQTDIRAARVSLAPAQFLESDCRKVGSIANKSYDLALTSPPYLNGTNYFRNTKLELWFAGMIAGEDELSTLHRSGITAGINNVSGKKPTPEIFDDVESVIHLFDGNGDRRIPLLIRHYVSDMFEVLKSTHGLLSKNGRFILDIGDSKFYGIHVPTDKFLILAAERAGFILDKSTVIAKRYSRDKSPLVQVELQFIKQ